MINYTGIFLNIIDETLRDGRPSMAAARWPENYLVQERAASEI